MSHKNLLQLILKKLKDQDQADKQPYLLVIGTIIIALSGLILYLDKAFLWLNISVAMPQKFVDMEMDQQTFVWLMAQTLSPILIIAGSCLPRYRASYIVPLYCYALQFFFILFDYRLIDDNYIVVYTLGTVLCILACIKIIDWINKKIVFRIIENEKKKLLEKWKK